MKTSIIAAIALAGVIVTVGIPAYAEDVKPADCKAVVKAVESEIKADPSHVLAVVAAKVKASPECACEVVKTAIKTTKASNELTGQIVEAAVRAAPKQYKVIVECAVAVNANAAAEIRAALLRVFGGKDGKGGKVVVVDPATMGDPKTGKPWTAPAAVGYILTGIDTFVSENTPPEIPVVPKVPEKPKTPQQPPRRPPFGGGGGTPTNPQPIDIRN